MMTDGFVHALLDAAGTAPTHISLHSAFPGNTGASELSGGGYARGAATWAAAASRARALAAPVTINVGAGSTVAWLGAWTAATGGTFRFCAPFGGHAPREFVADPAADTIISPGHGYAADQQVVIYDGTPPAPLVEGTVYFVRNPTADAFQLAATAGGTPINITAHGVGDRLKVCRIAVQDFAVAGSVEVSTATSYGITM